MMARMDDDDLLEYLEAEQADAFHQTEGQPSADRERALRDYLRYPYGTEQAGRSQIIASDVFDTVEGILPDLVEVFAASDKAVVFDPVGQEDVQGAKQATDACNYVFYKQNNGFIILYSAAKDALLLRTGGVKWWWDVKRTPNFETFAGDEMQIAAHLMANPKAQVIGKEEIGPQPLPPEVQQQITMMQAQGMPVPQPPMRFKVRLKTIEEKGRVCVEPVPPDELEISARHNSILLNDVPYIAHKRKYTHSDLLQMGFDVTVEDVKAAANEALTQDRLFLDTLRGKNVDDLSSVEDSMQRGWLREEYVLIDYDGDGIAERRKIMRLGKKILSNEEFSHVPIAAWTPYLLTHKFDGMSVWDLVGDLQRASTDILRNQLDNLALANNQETVVLTDANGNPKANIDDLLNRQPGGVIREYAINAVRPYSERWQGIEAMPMVELIGNLKEKRTGYSPVVPGIDANALNKTATEISKQSNDKQKRMKLMARIMGEALVKPMFRGIFKTLTDYCMDKVSFRLNGQFVQFDPQEWRDGYDMTVNVGIGTGDVMQQTQFLMQIAQAQGALAASPFGPVLVDAEKIYNVHSRLAELAGFKNPEEFWLKPQKGPDGKVIMPQPGPPPEVLKEQARGQVQMQIEQAKNQSGLQQKQAELQLQATNDARDAAREDARMNAEFEMRRMEAAHKDAEHQREIQFQMWKEELHAAAGIKEAQLKAQAATDAAVAAADSEIEREIQ